MGKPTTLTLLNGCYCFMKLSPSLIPSQSQTILFSKESTNPHWVFPIKKLIDITHTGSWHSCLLSSETLAPFLEFPGARPSVGFTRSWVRTQLKISPPDGCWGLQKQQVFWGQQVEQLIKAGVMLRFSSTVSVFKCAEWWYYRLLCGQGTAVTLRMPSDWNFLLKKNLSLKSVYPV